MRKGIKKQFWLSKEEADDLRSKAESTCLTEAALFRMLLKGYHPKENDVISVRGYGRFRYCGVLTSTKKGRYLVNIQRYV